MKTAATKRRSDGATKGGATGGEKGRSSAAEVARDEAPDLHRHAVLQATLRRMLKTHEDRFGTLELEPGSYTVNATLKVTGDVTKKPRTGGGSVIADIDTEGVLLGVLCAPIVSDLSPTNRIAAGLDFQRGARILGHQTKADRIDEAKKALKDNLKSMAIERGLKGVSASRQGATGGDLAITGSFGVGENEIDVQLVGAAGDDVEGDA